MEKKNIDWSNLGFGYVPTDYRFVANYKNGAWEEGGLTTDATVTISECAGVLQYAQTCFEGMKAYTTEDGRTVIFRPDLNAARMADSCRRLEMPVFPEDKFVEAVVNVVKANEEDVGITLLADFVYGSLNLRTESEGIAHNLLVTRLIEIEHPLLLTHLDEPFIHPMTL